MAPEAELFGRPSSPAVVGAPARLLPRWILRCRRRFDCDEGGQRSGRNETNEKFETHLNGESTAAKITAEGLLSRVGVNVGAKGGRASEALGCRCEKVSESSPRLEDECSQRTHDNGGNHIVLILPENLLLPPRQLLEARKRRRRQLAPKQQRRRRQRREELLQARQQRKEDILPLAELSVLARATSCDR